jgi:segregation and condensation protein B
MNNDEENQIEENLKDKNQKEIDLESDLEQEYHENDESATEINDLIDKDSEQIEDLESEENDESDTEIHDIIDKDSEQIEDLESEESDDLEIAEEKIEKEPLDEEKEVRMIQKNLIEGALYAAGSPLDIEEIGTKLEISKKLVEELITELAYEYLNRESALIIAQVGERYQMQLRPEYTETISKFTKGGAIAEKYLRTLTIIALKQPILKSTVVKIRGTGAYEHVKYLLDNELIIAEKKGRSHELMTTVKYADMFGLPKNREELKRMMISQLGLDEEKE